MKRLSIIIFLIFNGFVFGQSINLSNINSSKFPLITAEIYVNDINGNQIKDIQAKDIILKENGKLRLVNKITCPVAKPPESISSVLTLDISGSMGEELAGKMKLDISKRAANAWINNLIGKFECAITTFSENSFINVDFTTNKQRLIDATAMLLPTGGTDYDQAFLNGMTGAIEVAKKGKYKRVILFLSDGFPNFTPKISEIIKKSNENGINIYAVTLGINCPQILVDISQQTGGTYFTVKSEEEAIKAYLQILKISQGGEPCIIEWTSDLECQTYRNIELEYVPQNIKTTSFYMAPSSSVTDLITSPTVIRFPKVTLAMPLDTIINLKAVNSDVTVIGYKIDNSSFSINETTPFVIKSGTTKQIMVHYLPVDTGLVYCKIEFENTACNSKLVYCTSGKVNRNGNKKNLKLTFPNGSEQFVVGSDSIITWEGIMPDEYVTLKYSTDAGTNWNIISQTATNLKYIWKNIPDTPSNKCLMKVEQSGSAGNNQYKVISSIHQFSIYHLKVSPNKYTIASGDNLTMKVWDTDTKMQLWDYTSTNQIRNITYSKTGNMIALCGDMKNIYIFDSQSGTLVQTLTNPSNRVFRVAFSNDENSVYIRDEQGLSEFDLSSGAILRSLSNPTSVLADIALTPDGKFIAICSDKGLNVYSLDDFQLKKDLINYRATKVLFTEDGNRLFGIIDQGYIMMFDGHNFNPQNTVGSQFSYYYLYPDYFVSNYDGSTLCYLDTKNSSMIIFDVKQNKELFTRYLADVQNAVAFYNDYDLVSGGNSGQINIWNYADNYLTSTKIGGHSAGVNCLAFSNDGKYLASGSIDKTIKLWDTDNGKEIRTLTGATGFITTLCFHPSGQNIISGSSDGYVRIWDIATGNEIKSIHYYSTITSIDVSSDGNQIAVFTNANENHLINYNSPALSDLYSNFSNAKQSGYNKISFSMDDKDIAVGVDYNILVFRPPLQNSLYTLAYSTNVNSVKFSPDGKFIAGADDTQIKIWNKTDQSKFLTINSSGINSISYSRNSNKFVGCSDDEKIYVWNSTDYTLTSTLSGHNTPVKYVTVSNNGRYIASTDNQNRIFLWDLEAQSKQEDISDNLWSIIKPSATSTDIDMQKVVLGKLRDSVVKKFVINTGSCDFIIDSISIDGTDKDQFQYLSGTGSITIPKGNNISCEFSFTPKSIGNKSAKIHIYSAQGVIEQNIIGEGVLPKIEVISKYLDFGNVDIGKSKTITDTVLIKNISSQKIDITKTSMNGPDNKQFDIISAGGSFSLNPNETRKLSISFNPKYGGRTSGSVGFYFDGDDSPAIANLFGTGIGGVVYVMDDSAYPGEKRNIKFLLSNVKVDGLLTLASQFSLSYKTQKTILAPTEISNFDRISGDSIYSKLIGILKPGNELLAEIPMVAGLGEFENTSIDINSITLIDINNQPVEYELEKQSGNFKILGICKEGGKRLINPDGIVEIASVTPNPADGDVEIIINLIESGKSTLKIFDLTGLFQKTLLDEETAITGERILKNNLSDLSNGSYMLILETPTVKIAKNIFIIR